MKQILVVIMAGLLPMMIDAREPQPWPMLKAATDKSLLPGTEMLDWKGDLAVRMLDEIDRWLDGEIKANREAGTDLRGTREELARKLGPTLDARPADNAFVYSARRKGPVGHGRGYTIRQVRWRAFGELDAVGLLLESNEGQPRADIIALPDAGQPPEEICSLAPFGKEGRTTPFAGRMAMNGCRVLVPVLSERSGERHGMSTREWLHRPAWEMGLFPCRRSEPSKRSCLSRHLADLYFEAAQTYAIWLIALS